LLSKVHKQLPLFYSVIRKTTYSSFMHYRAIAVEQSMRVTRETRHRGAYQPTDHTSAQIAWMWPSTGRVSAFSVLRDSCSSRRNGFEYKPRSRGDGRYISPKENNGGYAMTKIAVEVEKEGNRLSFHFSGAAVTRANTRLLGECLSELIGCAERNGCLASEVNSSCLARIANRGAQGQENSRAGCRSLSVVGHAGAPVLTRPAAQV
jgi:hypothetical protein